MDPEPGLYTAGMPSAPSFPVRYVTRRVLHGVLARLRGRGGRRVQVVGIELSVPRGTRHPGLDPSAAFFHRTIGPMVAPEHRVLDVGCGVGLGAIGAASRGAAVLGVEPDPTALEACRGNAREAGIQVVEEAPSGGQLQLVQGDARDAVQRAGLAAEEPWDLVLWNAPQRSEAQRSVVLAALPALPDLLGERGRLLLVVERGSGLEAAVRGAMPFEYRVVELARDLGLRPSFRVLCLGFDTEAARARRHAERKRTTGAKAAVSRRKWEGKDTEDQAAPVSDSPSTMESQP